MVPFFSQCETEYAQCMPPVRLLRFGLRDLATFRPDELGPCWTLWVRVFGLVSLNEAQLGSWTQFGKLGQWWALYMWSCGSWIWYSALAQIREKGKWNVIICGILGQDGYSHLLIYYSLFWIVWDFWWDSDSGIWFISSDRHCEVRYPLYTQGSKAPRSALRIIIWICCCYDRLDRYPGR